MAAIIIGIIVFVSMAPSGSTTRDTSRIVNRQRRIAEEAATKRFVIRHKVKRILVSSEWRQAWLSPLINYRRGHHHAIFPSTWINSQQLYKFLSDFRPMQIDEQWITATIFQIIRSPDTVTSYTITIYGKVASQRQKFSLHEKVSIYWIIWVLKWYICM